MANPLRLNRNESTVLRVTCTGAMVELVQVSFESPDGAMTLGPLLTRRDVQAGLTIPPPLPHAVHLNAALLPLAGPVELTIELESAGGNVRRRFQLTGDSAAGQRLVFDIRLPLFAEEDLTWSERWSDVDPGEREHLASLAVEPLDLPVSRPPVVAPVAAPQAPAGPRPGIPSEISGGVIRVWFGTNRRGEERENADARFGNQRDEETHFGWCDVDVPRTHKIGSLGSSLFKRLLSGEDDRLRIVARRLIRREKYWLSLRHIVASEWWGARRATVFLHGYNVSFDEAALRAAQIGFDLQVPGPMCFFSWPSKGRLLGYAADAASIEASEAAIADYLVSVATETDAERVDVIAHSMGNRGLLRAIQRILARAQTATGTRFGHFILAAPDVDRAVFADLASLYQRAAHRTTLYISNRDKALWLSRLLYMYGRAGFAPPVTVVDGIDTVHVANVDLTLLGHGYIAEAREVLNDIHSLLTFDAPPERRMGLRTALASTGRRYWVIAK